MARTIEAGFDDTLTGTIESTPANKLVFKGSEDAQASLRSLVEFHVGNLVAALPPGAEDPTADEVLDYVVSRMRGKRAWARRVEPGLGVPQMNAFCPTGEGGGQDNSCGSGEGGGSTVKSVNDFRGDLQPDPSTGRLGTKELSGVSVKGYRVGSTEDKHGRGVYFSGDKEGAEHYADLHPGESVKEYTVSLGRVLLAGHQNDVTREFFGKSYGDMHTSLASRSKDAAEGGRKLDVKIAKEALKRGYDGIIYVKPAPPAKSEIAVLKKGLLTENAFCPTGEGGGIDPSCSPGEGSGSSIAPTTTPLGKAPRLRGFGEPMSAGAQTDQVRIDAASKAKAKISAAAKSGQPKDADAPVATKATSADVRKEVEGTLKDFRERRGRVTVREAGELADKLLGMTVKDMRAVSSSLGVKVPSGRKAELVRELSERFRDKVHEEKGLKEVAAGSWVHQAEADAVVARIRHEGGAAWRVDDMPGDSSSRDKVFVGFEGSAEQAERHGFPLSERVRARLAKSSGKGKATKGRAKARVKNAYTFNAGAFAELVRPLPVWLDAMPDGSVSVREATDAGDEIKRVSSGQSFFEWSAAELWQLGRGAFELTPRSQAAAEAMLDGLDDDEADDVTFALTEEPEEAVSEADAERSDDGALAADFRREVRGKIKGYAPDDHGDPGATRNEGWRPVR